MNKMDDFIKGFSEVFKTSQNQNPWEITQSLSDIIFEMQKELNDDFEISNGIAIHKTAIIEPQAILKAPVIINRNCFIGAYAYLRNGVYLGESSSVGPSCEIKSSIIMNHSEIAHLNFIDITFLYLLAHLFFLKANA